MTVPDFSGRDFNPVDFPVAGGVYDLSGIASLQVTIAKMLADQQSGAVNFAGSEATWVPAPTGWFKAILSVGGSPSATTVHQQLVPIKAIRTIFDLLAGGTGTVAALAVQGVTPPSLLLETGKLVTGPAFALGPLINPALFVASTNYDLSGIASLQATASQMLADMVAGITKFVGWGATWVPNRQGQFEAIYVSGLSPQITNMGDVIARFTHMKAQYDLLGTVRGWEAARVMTGAIPRPPTPPPLPPPSPFILDESVLDGSDVLT